MKNKSPRQSSREKPPREKPPREKPPREPREPREQREQRKQYVIEGEILPFDLGQDGLTVGARAPPPPPPHHMDLPSGVPGDRVRVRSTVRGPVVDRLLEPSALRVIPACPLLDSCGGCSLQAMSYPAQVAAKTEALRRALVDLGSTVELPDVDRLTRPYGYRTKLLMAAGGHTAALRFGFYRRGSMALVPAEGCPVQHPTTLATLASVRQVLDAYNVGPTASEARRGDRRPTHDEGWLHAVGIRVDPLGGEVELTLSGATPRLPGGKAMALQLGCLPGVSGVHLSVNPQRTSYPMEGSTRVLTGRPHTAFNLDRQRVLLSPGTFFQTSAEAAELLLKRVAELMPERFELLADLYAGAGLLALGTREQFQRVVTLEANRVAVEDLRRYVKHAQLSGFTVLEGRVEQRVDEVLGREPANVVLLDPPRRGCVPTVTEALLRHRPKTVILVSCGFDPLLAQARQLLGGGYQITGAAAVDMSPHTSQLEVVLRFALA